MVTIGLTLSKRQASSANNGPKLCENLQRFKKMIEFHDHISNDDEPGILISTHIVPSIGP